jgi:hypothetical protein
MGLAGRVVDEALRGWPSSAEWLPAACDADVAPFDRGSIEVRVGPRRAASASRGAASVAGRTGVSWGYRPASVLATP